VTRARPARLAERLAGLHVLADDDPRWPHDPVAQARAACAGGAAVVQLRAKHASDRQALAFADEIRKLTADAGLLFLVNDRIDLARLAGADGVHLGQDDLPPERVPRALAEGLCIGRSSHTLAQASALGESAPDYVAMGPVFGTRSKASPWSARGLDLVAAASAAVAPLPLVAIGGIGAGQVRAVLRAGAAGIAVISAVAGAPDPERAVRALCGEMRADAVPAATPAP